MVILHFALQIRVDTNTNGNRKGALITLKGTYQIKLLSLLYMYLNDVTILDMAVACMGFTGTDLF